MFLINALNGRLEALLYDNGYLTNVRTAITGALTAKHLAKQDMETVGVIGAGAQAYYQLKALSKVRKFNQIYVSGKFKRRLIDFKCRMEHELNVSVIIIDDIALLARESDLIITTTPARSPVLKANWIQLGTHIIAVGADTKDKNELDPRILKRAKTYIADDISQCKVIGELRTALQTDNLQNMGNILELSDLIVNQPVTRSSSTDITVADLTGTGVQDTKIALYAYTKLTEEK